MMMMMWSGQLVECRPVQAQVDNRGILIQAFKCMCLQLLSLAALHTWGGGCVCIPL